MIDCQEEQTKSSFHMNEKIKSYTLSFKLLVVQHAKSHQLGQLSGNRVDRRRIREWIQNESKMQNINKVHSKKQLCKETRRRWKKD